MWPMDKISGKCQKNINTFVLLLTIETLNNFLNIYKLKKGGKDEGKRGSVGQPETTTSQILKISKLLHVSNIQLIIRKFSLQISPTKFNLEPCQNIV